MTFLDILSADDWDSHFTQGEALEHQGKYAAAVSEFEAALPAATAFGADDWRLPITLHNLGTVYRETGRYADAERCYRRAIAIFETHQLARKAELAGTLNNLGALDLVMGRNRKAGELYGRAYRLRVEALGAMHPLTAASLQGLAQVAQERRQYAEADRLYRQAARILEPALGAESLAMADLRHNWALLDRDAGRDRDALPLLERAEAIYTKAAPLHPKRAIVLRNLADLEMSASDLEKSGALFEQALDICAKSLPPDHPETGVILQAYSRFLYRVNRKKEGRVVAERARAILAKSARENGVGYSVDVTTLGRSGPGDVQ